MEENLKSKCYRQSGKFSVSGAVLLTLSVAVIGTVLFFIYLLFNQFCTFVYLEMLAACLVSVALGFITGKIIKAFKMRNTVVAVACVMVGFLIATYVKWVAYDYMDVKNNIYEGMQESTATSYYGFDYIFANDDEFEVQYEALHEMSAVDDIDGAYSEEQAGVSRDSETTVSDESIWESLGFDELLGTDIDEARESVKQAGNMNAYDFTFGYRGMEKISLGSLLTSPENLWNDICDINTVGRWSYSSSHSSSTSTPVNGVILWIVWGCELCVLAGFMLVQTVERSRLPFIESENDWAKEKQTRRVFRYAAKADNIKQLRVLLNENFYGFFDTPIEASEPSTMYVGVDIYTSKECTENYISAYLMKYNQKNKKFIEKPICTYYRCDKDFIERMVGTFTGQK